MYKTKNLFALVLAITLFSCSKQLEIYVSPVGNDTNDGSFNHPFRTLEKARDQIRSLKYLSNDGVTVFLREGSYRIEDTFVLGVDDSGTIEAPIKYTSYSNEDVSITGGISINPEMVEKLNTEEVKFFNSEISANIRKLDLFKLGITDFGTLKNVGFARPYTTSGLELFVNNVPYELAKYPNKRKIAMGEIIDPGSIPSEGDFSKRGGKFKYDDNRLSKWKFSNDIWISGYFNKGWAEDAVQIEEIDTVQKIITTVQPHHYGFGNGAEWKQWYAFNVLEEIDVEREYYLNRETGVLYFYSDLKTPISTIEVSILEKPLIAMEGVSNVIFSDITFECSRGMGIYIERGSGNQIKDCIIRNLGGVGINLGKGVASDFSMKHDLAKSEIKSRELGSLPQYIYKHTTFNREAGTNHGIVNCHIYQVGAGAVVLGGGDRNNLTKGGNYVQNCLIHDYNRIEKSYRPGIWIMGVGNRISNCEIFNAPMMAIWLHGNDHIIEYSDFHDVVQEMHDQGAIYYGRNPTERGNIVRYNYFHNLGSERLSVAVYHDDGACDMTVHGNIFYKAGSMPVLIGGGNDNSYTNNVFLKSKIGIHVDNRKQGWAKGSGEKGGRWEFEERMNAVDFMNPPYSEKYPRLKNYWKEEEAIKYPTNNLVKNNVFYGINKVIDGDKKWLSWKENIVLDKTPSFWNDDTEEFVLQNGQLVIKELTGFESIDIDKIGCSIKH